MQMNDRGLFKLKKLACLLKKKQKTSLPFVVLFFESLILFCKYRARVAFVSGKNVLDCFVLYCFIKPKHTVYKACYDTCYKKMSHRLAYFSRNHLSPQP